MTRSKAGEIRTPPLPKRSLRVARDSAAAVRQVVTGDGKGLGGRAEQTIMAERSYLMKLEREEKLSARNIVLIEGRPPDTPRDGGLRHDEVAAVIDLTENAGANGNIADDVGIRVDQLRRR